VIIAVNSLACSGFVFREALLHKLLHMSFTVDPFRFEPVVLAAQEPEVRERVVPAPGKGHDVIDLKIMSRPAPFPVGRDIAAPATIPVVHLVTDPRRDMSRRLGFVTLRGRVSLGVIIPGALVVLPALALLAPAEPRLGAVTLDVLVDQDLEELLEPELLMVLC
jgi:hypothetical protein